MTWQRQALAGAGAICASIGLGRFAYVPLFPAMVAAGWVGGGGAGLLGAANLAGYLLGVMGGRRLAARLGVARALDVGMALAALFIPPEDHIPKRGGSMGSDLSV